MLQKRKGLFSGLAFTAISFLLVFTFVVPMAINVIGFSIYNPLANIIDSLMSNFEAASLIAGAIITLVLAIIIAFTLGRIKLAIDKKKIESTEITYKNLFIYFLILFIPVQNLAFFACWAFSGYKPDAQILINSLGTFFFGGLLFIPFGLLIDIYIQGINFDLNRE